MRDKKVFEQTAEYKIDSTYHNYRLDKYLSKIMPWYSRTQLQEYIERGEFYLNGLLAKKGDKVKQSSVLLRKYLREEPDIDINTVIIKTIYEDDDIVVFDKPPTIAVHPNSAYQSGTMLQILEEKYNYKDLKLTHRIDKETSGLILLAKNTKYANLLTKYFFNRKIEKTYLAIAKGIVKDKEFSVKLNLGTALNSIIRIKQGENNSDGLFSHTDFKLIKQYNNYALIQCYLHTGRQHQIRAHLAHYGNYIIGDKIYGPDETIFDKFVLNGFTEDMLEQLETERHLLHSYKLSFFDEIKQKQFLFKAPLPVDMINFIKKIK